MKICLLSYRGQPYCGGQGIYIYYLSRELSRLGHEVQLLSGPPHPEVVEAVKVHKVESLNLYDLPGFSPKESSQLRNPVNLYEFVAVRLGMFPEPLTFSIRAYGKLRELLSHTRFDVIHDNQCLGYGLLRMKRLKIPLVSTIHHPISIDRQIELDHARSWQDKFRIMKWYSFINMQRLVSRRMDRVITVSHSSEADISRLFKVPRKKLRVVYNGVDGSLFTRDNSVAKQPNSLIMVGETRIKGIRFLLRALQLLNNEMKVKLTVVGRGTLNNEYASRLVKEYGLEDQVTFTGRISPAELVSHYSAAEVAVVPSLYEGFGFPAAEAMSCKAPLIATRAGALPEVVGEDGEAGILVPPRDPDALAAAIKRLLSDGQLRSRMGEAGRRRAERNFTWEQAAKRTLEVYQELM